MKSYEKQNHPLDTENPDDIRVIEKLLWDSKPDANQRTQNSLLREHQLRFGIVTANGMIIDGNRRAYLLNKIWNDTSIDVTAKGHTKFFLAVVLPVDADKREILRLETSLQMGEDAKVDYGPIEKYLKTKDLETEGFTIDEIAAFMGVKTTEVKDYQRILALMDDYLDTYGYGGIYTMLETREDSFIKLQIALRHYRSGNATKMWDYDIERDVSDLTMVAFDYIRFGLDQRDFRDIINKPANNSVDRSLFSNKAIWKDFSATHFATMNAIPEEESVDSILQNAGVADIHRLLIARNHKWRNAVERQFTDNFIQSRDKLFNKQQAAEPVKLFKKAISALMAIDKSLPSFITDPSIPAHIQEIEKLLKEFKMILGE
ncbi:MAG: hypothetical protein LBU04_05755 [Christensenellaceae bacterium]|nr:hypothetical protein [Christensenellaceae bacterium]